MTFRKFLIRNQGFININEHLVTHFALNYQQMQT